MVPQSDYTEREFTAAEIRKGIHRKFIGGSWDIHGRTQLDYLKARGLRPQDKVLDVGCGCLRAGRHLIDYLEPGNYYGIDANRSLLQAGYDVELTDEQRERMPANHLRANERFDGDFGVQFDVAIAQSVFTHVTLNQIRLCLFRVAKVVRPGGVFYATFFEKRRSTPIDAIFSTEKRPFFTEQDVFWYYRDDIRWAAGFAPWQVHYIGDWGHPHGQKMMQFTRRSDDAPADLPPLRRRVRRSVRRGRAWAARRLAP